MPSDVLERLGRANPLPDDLPAPPIEPLLERLEATPARSARWRLSGGMFVVLSIGLVVLVAGIVLTTAAHRRPSVVASAASGERQLVAELGVLRRPQTAADLTLPRMMAAMLAPPGGRVDSSLTRLAATVGVGSHQLRVYLLVTVPAAAPDRSASSAAKALGARVYALEVDRRGGLIEVDVEDAASLKRPHRPLGGSATGTIVPDGVARVRLTFESPRGQRSAFQLPVHGNVAVAPTERYLGQFAGVTWYDRTGRVI